MVTQCDAAFRLLVRRHGCHLVYSEMLMAKDFAADAAYRATGLGLLPGKSTVPDADHPLIVQFAANDPAVLLAAALEAQLCGADAVDINLGCPQNRARDGHYGSFLTDPRDWDLVCSMVQACVDSPELRIPVCCKIRLQPTVDGTVAFALQLQKAGCSLLTVHGRKRGNENHRRHGPANLEAIAAVKAALSIPVLSNGNVSSYGDALEALHVTRCDGVMSAEELLRDPSLFARCDVVKELGLPPTSWDWSPEDVAAAEAAASKFPDSLQLADEYLSLCCQYMPSSVWEEAGVDVAIHHVVRFLQHRYYARDFLEEPEFLGVKSVDQLIDNFRKRFAGQLAALQSNRDSSEGRAAAA